MAKTVRLKVKATGKIVSINELHAQRLVGVKPNDYEILEPLKYEKIVIPIISQEVDVKKKDEPVVDERQKRGRGRPRLS